MDINLIEKKLEKKFKELEDIALFNQQKVLDAFKKNKVSLANFNGTTGYGYSDVGRETLEKVFATVFKAEAGLVSPHISCGTTALTLTLFGLLRPNDLLLSIADEPYDTLTEVISGERNGSLKDFKIDYKCVPLKNGELDQTQIFKAVKKHKPKVIYLQRSRGYAWRNSILVEEMEPIFSECKKISPNSIIVVDNCYGEFTEKVEPTEVGADVCVGSLIKNPGAGIAPNGAYIVGKENLIDLIAGKLNSPSLKREVGSFEQGYRLFYQGLFLAPHVVKECLKGVMLATSIFSELGFEVLPNINRPLSDIVCSVKFNDRDKLIKFIQTIQFNSPVDSFVLALPWAMPGYTDEVIMASGSFVAGSSIELSADAPIRPPYIAYMQGGLTYEHIKIALTNVLNELNK